MQTMVLGSERNARVVSPPDKNYWAICVRNTPDSFVRIVITPPARVPQEPTWVSMKRFDAVRLAIKVLWAVISNRWPEDVVEQPDGGVTIRSRY